MGKTEKEVRLKIYDLIKITENKKKEMPEKDMGESILLKYQKISVSDLSGLSNLKVLEICDV